MIIFLIFYSSSPPDGYCGDPPNNLYCTSCHTGALLNPGNGLVYIPNMPLFYVPGDSYDLNIVVKGIGSKRFGFEMVIKDSLNNILGTFQALNSNTTVSPGGYAKHQNAPFSIDSFVFQVRWKTPTNYFGRAFVYLVGNVANGNGLSSGDSIYSKTYIINSQSNVQENDNLKVLKTKDGFLIEVKKKVLLKIDFYSLNGNYEKIFEGYLEGKRLFKIKSQGIVKIRSDAYEKTFYNFNIFF